MAHLQERAGQSEDEIKKVRAEIAEITDVGLSRLTIRSQIVQRRYDKERESFKSLQSEAINLRNEVRDLTQKNEEYQGLVDLYESDLREIASDLPLVEVRYRDFDQQVQNLQTTFEELDQRIRESDLARLDEDETILVLEAAVESKTPVPETSVGASRLLIGAVLGAVLGALLAFAWYYIPSLISASREPSTS